MTLEEMKNAALTGLGKLGPKNNVPQEFKDQMAANQAPYAKPDQWNRGEEAGLNETSGLDILREPKASATKALGGADNPMAQLMNMLVPDEVSPSMLSGVGIIKPKTPMNKLTTPTIGTWDKTQISKDIAEKLQDNTPMWKKKLMEKGK